MLNIGARSNRQTLRPHHGHYVVTISSTPPSFRTAPLARGFGRDSLGPKTRRHAVAEVEYDEGVAVLRTVVAK